MDVGRPARVWAAPSGSSSRQEGSRKSLTCALPLAAELMDPVVANIRTSVSRLSGNSPGWGRRQVGSAEASDSDLSIETVLPLLRVQPEGPRLSLSGIRQLFTIR